MTEHCGCGCGHSHEHQKEGYCSCGCGKHHHMSDSEGGCHCTEKLLMIADEAWKEVLKDKIKEKILAKKGEHMDNLAELIATANGQKWKHIISAKMKCDEFKDQIKNFFSSSSCE